MRRTPGTGQRGLSLIEALTALAVLGSGLVAVIDTHVALAGGADAARQRAEAARLAQEDLETVRAFVSLEGAGPDRSYADIADAVVADAAGYASNTRYTVSRTVVRTDAPRHLSASVTVRWLDRHGNEAVPVILRSIVAGADPALAGRLGAPPAAAAAQPGGRHRGIPLSARDLADGTSAFVPAPAAGIAWLFDNAVGTITGVCEVPAGTDNSTVTRDELSRCVATAGLLLSGQVRFATETVPDAAAAERPSGTARPLDLLVTLSAGLGGTCFDDTGATAVTYHCLVRPDPATGRWSGRATVAPDGWRFGAEAGAFRLCRYSADLDLRHGITNEEHPASYTDVGGALVNQNFLVIAGPHACPHDGPANPARGDFVDSSTVQHEPSA